MAQIVSPKSDDLPELKKILESVQAFSWLSSLIELPLIVDASAIIEDIRWLACISKTEGARTNLLEAIEAQIILAYAPTFIEQEINQKLPKIANEEGIGLEHLKTYWDRYRSNIHLIDCGGPDENFLDPKDAPYVKLHYDLKAPVSTRDPHFAQMGVPVISVQAIQAAKEYSRESAVEYTIKISGMGSIVISASIMRSTWEVLRPLIVQVKRLPDWAWLALVSIICTAIISDRFREWITQKVTLYTPKVGSSVNRFLGELISLVEQHHQSRQRTETLQEKITAALVN